MNTSPKAAIAYLAKQKNYRLSNKNGIVRLEHFVSYGYASEDSYCIWKTICTYCLKTGKLTE